MRTTQKLTVGAGVVGALLAALFAVPEKVAAQELAQVYEIEAKQGAQQALESALKRHSEWREEHGDPWNWTVAEVVQGKHTGSFVIRSGGHSWSDFDEYWQGFGAKAEDHYNATVAPLVESTTSFVSEYDSAASYIAEEDPEFSLVYVNTYKVKPGHGEEWHDAVEQVNDALAKEGYPDNVWVYDYAMGAYSSDASIVVAQENWAGFETPEPSIGDAVEEVYGEEKASEIFEQFGNSFRTYENKVYQIRPDLSVEADSGGGQ